MGSLSGPGKPSGEATLGPAGAIYLDGASRDNPNDPKSDAYKANHPPAPILPPVTPLPSGGAMPSYLDSSSEDKYRQNYLNTNKPNYNFAISSETNKPTSYYSQMANSLKGNK